LFFSYLSIVLRPVNLVTETVVILIPKEHYYQRSRLVFNMQIEQLDFYVDSKQVSDILDFIKFQSYTITYGILIVNDLFEIFILFL
jgi:hypothetical protein